MLSLIANIKLRDRTDITVIISDRGTKFCETKFNYQLRDSFQGLIPAGVPAREMQMAEVDNNL